MHKVDQISARGAGLITDAPFSQGEIIANLRDCTITPIATYQTIQIGRDSHLEDLGIIAYLNHSCRPNTVVDTDNLLIYAARDIAVGEELTFFYPSTEWEMARPFACACGAAECVRIVVGAKFLSVDTLSRYYINPHIRELVSEALLQQPLPAKAMSTVAEPYVNGIQKPAVRLHGM